MNTEVVFCLLDGRPNYFSNWCDFTSCLENTMDVYAKVTTGYIIALLYFSFLFLINIFQYKKSKGVKIPPVLFFLCLVGYLFVLPFGTLTLLLLTINRKLVGFILKIKYGSEFRGLLDGADAIFNVEGVKNVINILMICEYDERRYSQTLLDTAKQTFYNLYFLNPERFPKFLYTFQKFMGYSFMLKNKITIDDCVKRMNNLEGHKEILEREDVIQLITECTNAPLPKNGTILWEVLVGSQPVNWNRNDNNNETKSYPVMFRVHHSVADGVSLIKLLIGAFADNPNAVIISPERWKERLAFEKSQCIHHANPYKESENVLKTFIRFYKYLQNVLEVFLMSAYVLCLAPTTFYHQALARDFNILQGPVQSGELVLALNAEVSQKYVKIAKRIKNKVPGTAFSEVILTAFSASLDEYFVKNSSSYPRTITAVVPVVSGSSELKELTPGSYDIDVKLKNKFSLVYLTLPLHVSNDDDKENKPVLKRLKLVQAETRALGRSADYIVNHWILSVGLGLFPRFAVKFFLYLAHCTVLSSVLPGPPKITLCGGSSVQDIAFWVPHIGHTGVGFSAVTYDGRFQLGLNIDKALISDKQAADRILNNVYKYIDILDEETS